MAYKSYKYLSLGVSEEKAKKIGKGEAIHIVGNGMHVYLHIDRGRKKEEVKKVQNKIKEEIARLRIQLEKVSSSGRKPPVFKCFTCPIASCGRSVKRPKLHLALSHNINTPEELAVVVNQQQLGVMQHA